MINASFEKVENVVKPPQKPTVRKRAQLLPSLAPRLKSPQRHPIRRHPRRFAARVAQGRLLPRPFISNDITYLAAPPRKLPLPTIRIFFNISEFISTSKTLSANKSAYCLLAAPCISLCYGRAIFCSTPLYRTDFKTGGSDHFLYRPNGSTRLAHQYIEWPRGA